MAVRREMWVLAPLSLASWTKTDPDLGEEEGQGTNQTAQLKQKGCCGALSRRYGLVGSTNPRLLEGDSGPGHISRASTSFPAQQEAAVPTERGTLVTNDAQISAHAPFSFFHAMQISDISKSFL